MSASLAEILEAKQQAAAEAADDEWGAAEAGTGFGAMVDRATTLVRLHPWQSLGVALGVGMIVAMIVRRR